MKATEAKLMGFLQKSPQFIIPIYQRTYSWTDKQSRQLWDDILRAGSSDLIAVHFIGSIVYVEQGLSQVTHQAPLLVIDGQQRLTTVSLLIEALARALGDSEPVDGFSAVKLRHYYLSNPLESGMLLAAVVCIKHDGFKEEAEWRAIYSPNREPSPLIAASTEIVSGVPQLVYSLPLDGGLSSELVGLDFGVLFDRLIIGPSQYPLPMAMAFVDALKHSGISDAEKRVCASMIPIRG